MHEEKTPRPCGIEQYAVENDFRMALMATVRCDLVCQKQMEEWQHVLGKD